jgi:hypothetical protein
MKEKLIFREEGHQRLMATLDRFQIPHELVTVRPFIEEVEFETQRSDVFVFGSLKLARLAKKYGWFPGALVTKNHDYEVYTQYYQNHLLNYDSRIIKASEDFEWEYEEQFIRPTLDSKVFTGKVFKQEEWFQTRDRLLDTGYANSLTEDTMIQVARPKKITQEIRNWVVKSKIVTASTYRRGSFLVYDRVVDNDALAFAQEMIDIFQLAKTFVIDIALTDEGWKIIECGSTSCAGFYDADLQKLIMALEKVKWD